VSSLGGEQELPITGYSLPDALCILDDANTGRRVESEGVASTCLDHDSDHSLQEHKNRLVDYWARILVAEYHRRRAEPADGGRNTEGGKVM
jgi:hypothetical protein